MDLEKIKALSGEALAEAIAEYSANLDAALAVENPTNEDVTKAREVSETLSALEAEKAERDKDAEDFAALQERQAARKAEASAQPDEDEDDEDAADSEDDEDDEDDEVEEAVTASARTSARKAVAKRGAPKVPDTPSDEDETPRVTITASADVKGFETGSALNDLRTTGQAMLARMEAFPKPSGQRGGAMHRYGVANFQKPIGPERTAKGGDSDFQAIDEAIKESRLQGGSLVAAGGWCAPSETLYDLCAVETTEGLLDLPEFAVTRGGVRFTSGADFSTLYDGGFWQTEAEAIAGTEKDCIEIACPDFQEVRLEANGLCIKVPLLTQTGYPELISNTMERALIAYQHKQSATLTQRMATAAGDAVIVPSVGSTAVNTLSSLELVADQVRASYVLAQNHSMEVLLPFWVKSAIRADLANRNGVDMMSVTDQQIQSHFAARNLQVQWLYNWQPNAVGSAYPETVQALIYPAGTYVKGTASVINLDAVYDAASLSVNTYTGMFFEEGILLLQRCYPSRLVEITICSGGRTGAADNVECLTGEATP